MKKIELSIRPFIWIFGFIFLVGCKAIEPECNVEKAAQLNIKLGLAYLQDDQLHRAKLKLNRAMSLAPKLSEAHYSMAFYYERVGEVEAARQAYQRAIALNPIGGIEHNNYGAFLCRQQDYRLSEKEFLLAISDPNYLNSAEALENAGLCVLAIPDEAKAMTYFKRALSHDLKRPHALIELAYLYYQKKDRDSALHYYKRYLKIAEPTERSKWLGNHLEKFS